MTNGDVQIPLFYKNNRPAGTINLNVFGGMGGMNQGYGM